MSCNELRPDDLDVTMAWLTGEVVPAMGTGPSSSGTLRDRFGLPRPANRYAVVSP